MEYLVSRPCLDQGTDGLAVKREFARTLECAFSLEKASWDKTPYCGQLACSGPCIQSEQYPEKCKDQETPVCLAAHFPVDLIHCVHMWFFRSGELLFVLLVGLLLRKCDFHYLDVLCEPLAIPVLQPTHSTLFSFPWHFKRLLINWVCLQNTIFKKQLYFWNSFGELAIHVVLSLEVYTVAILKQACWFQR